MEDAAKNTADSLQSLSDTASNINKSFTENQADVSALEEYGQIMEDLLPKTQRTAEEQARLEEAVKHVNSITGESLSVSEEYSQWLYNEGDGAWYTVDALKGEYNAIEDLIDVKQREMEADVLRQAESEVRLEKLTAERNLADAYAQQAEILGKVDEAQQLLDSHQINYDTYSSMVSEYENQLADLGETIETNKQIEQEASDAADLYSESAILLGMASGDAADPIAQKLSPAFDTLFSLLAANGQSVLDFRNELNDAGIDTKRFSELTDTELETLAKAYDGSFGSIQGLLEEYGVSFDEAATKTSDNKEKIENDVNELAGNVSSLADRMSRNVTYSVQEMGDDVTEETGQIKSDVESDFAFPNASTWGRDLISNFIGNVTSHYWSWGAGQITSIAQNIKDTFGHSVPAKGPLHNHGRGEVEWGEHLVENIITGINNRQEALNATMNDLALMMSSPAEVLDYMDSPEFSQSVSFRTVSADDVYMATLRALNDSEGTEIYLDGDVLVGKTAKRMDTALGARRSLVGRGVG